MLRSLQAIDLISLLTHRSFLVRATTGIIVGTLIFFSVWAASLAWLPDGFFLALPRPSIFPWAACNGATEWRIHLNPMVPSDITAHSNGGNVELNLSGMLITGLSAETGGGNMNVILPDNAADLNIAAMTGGGNVSIEIGRGTTGSNIVTAKSGAGNVVVGIPNDVAARIYATTGLGKVILDPRFDKIADNTYQSSDFDVAANKVEMTLQSGAGNVSVNSR